MNNGSSRCIGVYGNVHDGFKVVVVDVENELKGNYWFLLVVIGCDVNDEQVQFFLDLSKCECQLFQNRPKKI